MYSWRDELDYVQEGAAWTKKSGKNPEGGLNEKGRKSYERENPGSDLKAPQPEGGSRKKSFCARMGGMKKETLGEVVGHPLWMLPMFMLVFLVMIASLHTTAHLHQLLLL